jgi:hypothetical protein
LPVSVGLILVLSAPEWFGISVTGYSDSSRTI